MTIGEVWLTYTAASVVIAGCVVVAVVVLVWLWGKVE